ncbi:MAG: BlaI/MecI/CopY family transcriptional regulator [Ruminococcus sp.]|nr:BlaI/MecI/CopY family transcriptional regulator [Ruminococcus sp.]
MLTKSEKQIMALLWRSEESLTTVDILRLCENKTFKDSYINILIRSLLKKDMIKVDGVELIGRSYARKFTTNITREEYIYKLLVEDSFWNVDEMPPLFAKFVQTKADMKILDDFSSIISERKEELKGE